MGMGEKQVRKEGRGWKGKDIGKGRKASRKGEWMRERRKVGRKGM